jgi:hypothetical protein
MLRSGDILFVLATMLCSAQVTAQGNDATTSSSSGSKQQGLDVQVGAGALTDSTTTGTSGPAEMAKKTTPEPLEPTFSIRPDGDLLWGPRRLSIRTTVKRRCNVIEDSIAKARCERQ